MLTMQGRSGLGRRPWLARALAASGLVLAVADAQPIRACHITHTKAEPLITATAPSAPTVNPQTVLQQSFQNLLHDLPAQTVPPTPTITPTAATTPVAAAQILTPTPASSTPTVSNWHQTTASPVMPPTPTCTTPVAAQTITPPAPLLPPAALLTPPTPAPEPSTILTAAALVGVFAWRRRASRPAC